MANAPSLELHFEGACPDCGERVADLPDPLPPIGDDFDWEARDYDRLRLFMLEELAARFPDRRRWTPADVEVVLIEVVAALLDQHSDAIDRVASEAHLETARRPESVRRLLGMIGYDAVERAAEPGEPPLTPRELDDRWLVHPEQMELARRAGPREIRTQRRMVTLDDYGRGLAEHPLVERAAAWVEWGGSWTIVRLAVIGLDNRKLDETGDIDDAIWKSVEQFHTENALRLPNRGPTLTLRQVLRRYVQVFGMTGQEVRLVDAIPVGIMMSFSVQVSSNYYRSEVRRAIDQQLATAPGGFFEPGRLRFGEDLHASDLVEVLMALEGVRNVCINRLKRVGMRHPDRSKEGHIRLDGLEIAVCDNGKRGRDGTPSLPDRGYYQLKLRGGLDG